MRNGPDLWDAILRQMPTGSIIAGGAVRDWFLGVEPKDIDVFMAMKHWPIDATPVGFHRLGPDRNAEYESMNEIGMIRRGTISGYQVDMVAILTDLITPGFDYLTDAPDLDGAALMPVFDFGITRSWYNGEIHDTPEAMADRNDYTVTLLDDRKVARAVMRFERFTARHCGAFRYGAGWEKILICQT